MGDLTRFDVEVLTPAGAGVGNLKDWRASNLVLSNALYVGNELLTCTLPATGNEPTTVHPALGPFRRVRVWDGGTCLWDGRMSAFKFVRNAGEGYWTLMCKGWGAHLGDALRDAGSSSTRNIRNTLTSTVISNLFSGGSALTTLVDTTDIATGAYTISNTADILLQGLPAGVVIAYVSLIEQNTGSDLIWYVYPTPAGQRKFTYKARPGTAGLFTRSEYFGERAEWGFDEESAANQAVVQYGVAGSLAVPTFTYSAAASSTLQSDWGFTKSILLKALELGNATDAARMANALLQRYSSLRMAGTSFVGRFSPDDVTSFRDSGGAPVRPYEIRAGEVMQFADIDPTAVPGASGAVTFANSFLVSRTRWSEDTNTLELEPEGQEATMERTLMRAVRLLRSQLTTRFA